MWDVIHLDSSPRLTPGFFFYTRRADMYIFLVFLYMSRIWHDPVEFFYSGVGGIKIINAWVLQDLTKIGIMAEEQCCCGLATARLKRVGGYRVGFWQRHIQRYSNRLWYNRGIKWANRLCVAEPPCSAFLFGVQSEYITESSCAELLHKVGSIYQGRYGVA